MLSAGDLERLAAELRRAAGVAPGDVVRAETIARPLVGPVLRVSLKGTRAMLFDVTGTPRIALRPGVADANFLVAHELGHYAVRYVAKMCVSLEHEEQIANALGPAILAPSVPFRQARRAFGVGASALASIALLFGLSQTATVLREAEVEEDERAVVTRTGHVLMRGLAPPWAPHDEVRAWARRPPPGIVKARLYGGIDEGRIAIRVG